MAGTEIRILDDLYREVGTGEVGQIYAQQHCVRRLHLGETKHRMRFFGDRRCGYPDAAGPPFSWWAVTTR